MGGRYGLLYAGIFRVHARVGLIGLQPDVSLGWGMCAGIFVINPVIFENGPKSVGAL